jgi:hypothetical protein
MTGDAERRLAASVAANVRWSKVIDRRRATEPGRRAAFERFERLVDPEGKLDPSVRARLAENLRRAHMAKAALASVRARRRRARRADNAREGEAKR